MIRLSSRDQMLKALGTARSIAFSSYILPDGEVKRALENAAKRGAHVTVRLTGALQSGMDRLAEQNAKTIERFNRLGACAKLVHLTPDDGDSLHMKAAVCDGVAYMDDRNFPSKRDTVLKDDTPGDVRAITRAARDQHAHCVHVQLARFEALAAETALLRTARGNIDVATEQIGTCGVYSALKALALAHRKVCLLISNLDLKGQHAADARKLQSLGVQVRVGKDADEKMAIANGRQAWVGSANATSLHYESSEIDWGVRTRAQTIVDALEKNFQMEWRSAIPLKV